MSNNRDLTKRSFMTLIIIGIYALGQQIVLPFVNLDVARAALDQNLVLQLAGMASGGQTNIPSLLSLGIMPYMTSMIVWSAISAMDLRSIRQLSIRVTGTIQNILALIFAVIQAVLYTLTIQPSLQRVTLWGSHRDAAFIAAVIVFTAGGMMAIALTNQNSIHGIGGQAVLIIPGMILGLSGILKRGWGMTTFELNRVTIPMILILTFLFIVMASYLTRAEYRLTIERPMLDHTMNRSYLPMPLLTSGAMPFMFSSMIFTIPRMAVRQLAAADTAWGIWTMRWTDYTHWQGILSYAIVLILLSYAFGLVNLQPGKQARQLREGGDYILNTTPGAKTEALILAHFRRLTFVSTLITLVIGTGPLLLNFVWSGVANLSPFIGNVFIIVTIVHSISENVIALYNKDRYQLFQSLSS